MGLTTFCFIVRTLHGFLSRCDFGDLIFLRQAFCYRLIILLGKIDAVLFVEDVILIEIRLLCVKKSSLQLTVVKKKKEKQRKYTGFTTK